VFVCFITRESSYTALARLSHRNSVRPMAYLGGHGAMAPLWPDHENFLQATLYEKVHFCHFPARIAKFNNV